MNYPFEGDLYILKNCVEPRKGPCVKLFTKVHQLDLVYKTNLKFEISMRKKYQKMEVSKFLYFALVQIQFDAIYSMILDLVS